MKHLSIGNVTGVLSLLLAIYALFRQYDPITSAILGAYGFVFIAWFIVRECMLSRKARYAEAAAPMAQCMTHLKLASEAIEQGNQQLAYQEIRGCLESFSTAFTLVTGVLCRACICTVTIDEDRISTADPVFEKAYVTRIFCRSSESAADPVAQWVPISENTDFDALCRGKTRRFWLSNDISVEPNYKNSSLRDLYGGEWKEYFKNRRCRYISTIVWPVAVNSSRNSGEAKAAPDDLVGFLCVDSKVKKVFNLDYDVDLGFALAESLFSVLYDYGQKFQ